MRAFLALIFAGLCLGWGGEARAHAVLLETVPTDRAVVADAPAVIILRFNEIVSPISVELRSSSAARVPVDIRMVDHEIHVMPRGPIENGAYFVSFRVTSADSHPVAGSFLFAIGAVPAEWSAPGLSAPALTAWGWAAALNRALLLIAVALSLGGVMFAALFGFGDAARAIVVPAAGVGFVSAISGIFLQGGYLLGAAAFDPFAGSIWTVGFDNTRGVALSVAAVSLVLMAARSKSLVAVGSLGVLGSFVLSGHAATAVPVWIAVPTLLLHVGVVAFWLGSLLPLLAVLNDAPDRHRVTFRKFSDVAIVVVPQLVIAGVILTTLQVQQLDALFGSTYSLILLAKLILVSLLFTLAACNRWILMPEMRDAVPGHLGRLRKTILAEFAFGVAILFVTAFLSQTVPPRALAELEGAILATGKGAGETALIETGSRKAFVSVTPARAGRNTIRVRVLTSADVPLEPLEVTVGLSSPRAGIEPLHRALQPKGDGYFELTGPELAVVGRWIVRVDALIDEFTKATFETELEVK